MVVDVLRPLNSKLVEEFLTRIETLFPATWADVDVELFPEQNSLVSFLPPGNYPDCLSRKINIHPLRLTLGHVDLAYLRSVLQLKVQNFFVNTAYITVEDDQHHRITSFTLKHCLVSISADDFLRFSKVLPEFVPRLLMEINGMINY